MRTFVIKYFPEDKALVIAAQAKNTESESELRSNISYALQQRGLPTKDHQIAMFQIEEDLGRRTVEVLYTEKDIFEEKLLPHQSEEQRHGSRYSCPFNVNIQQIFVLGHNKARRLTAIRIAMLVSQIMAEITKTGEEEWTTPLNVATIFEGAEKLVTVLPEHMGRVGKEPNLLEYLEKQEKQAPTVTAETVKNGKATNSAPPVQVLRTFEEIREQYRQGNILTPGWAAERKPGKGMDEEQAVEVATYLDQYLKFIKEYLSEHMPMMPIMATTTADGLLGSEQNSTQGATIQEILIAYVGYIKEHKAFREMQAAHIKRLHDRMPKKDGQTSGDRMIQTRRMLQSVIPDQERAHLAEATQIASYVGGRHLKKMLEHKGLHWGK
jgi:hypothetical protein